jgi:uncharacterized protein (TIGR00159 family)
MVPFLEDLQKGIRIADAVDIAVIAILLYSALVWFKQAASRGMIIGVSLLTALYLLARTLDMYLTSLIFHAAFAVMLIALVVLFQEEIRRALERVANWGTLGRPRQTSPLASEADTIIEAAFALAASRSGALIVLQGREPLRRHVDGGTELSGRISIPLLLSIFDPSSAGHDGAAIVDRDRVEYFGTHLPISKNQKQIRGRGTRHSAALGLSECSDALVIVVSEERGAVSVAEQGRLKEMPTAADLKARLERFFEDRFPTETRAAWKQLVTHHAGLKLLALSLAVLAWFVLAFNVEEIQTSILVPIEYRSTPEYAQVDEWAPAEALVTLSGSERSFRLLDRRALKISIDLSQVGTGSDYIRITEESLRLPPNLKVNRIRPDEIRVQLKTPHTGESGTAVSKE